MTKDEQLRYSRHMIMPEVGAEGQRRLNAARVLCIGAGGLGEYIFRGLAMVNNAVILAGAVNTASPITVSRSTARSAPMSPERSAPR